LLTQPIFFIIKTKRIMQKKRIALGFTADKNLNPVVTVNVNGIELARFDLVAAPRGELHEIVEENVRRQQELVSDLVLEEEQERFNQTINQLFDSQGDDLLIGETEKEEPQHPDEIFAEIQD
jgi:hypothetical protein